MYNYVIMYKLRIFSKAIVFLANIIIRLKRNLLIILNGDFKMIIHVIFSARYTGSFMQRDDACVCIYIYV